MDREKIGVFIAESRKNANLTQRELADKIGISDKTISKWERGNGLPEISFLRPLCDALNINVNELLSGERLDETDYSAKAEENMEALMEENEKIKRLGLKRFIIGIAVLLLAIFSLTAVTVGIGHSNVARFIDLPSLIMLALFSAAGIIFSGKRGLVEIMGFLRKIIMPIGLLVFLYEMINMLYMLDSPETLGPTIAIGLIVPFYAIIIWFISYFISTGNESE